MPSNLSKKFISTVLSCMGSKNSKRGDGKSSTKGETFFSLIKFFKVLFGGNLTQHHPSFPSKKTSFLQFGQVDNIHGRLFKKTFLICFSFLFPQAEQREDDEHFANYFQMYVSRTFTKTKKSVICAKQPMSSKFHLSKWKTYFSQFIDKFLKIEEVEYLIHYVKFKM